MDKPPNRAIESDGLAQLAQARRLARPSDRVVAIVDPQPSPAEQPLGLPFQFRLRTMLTLVAAVSGLLAIMQVIGAVWSAILVWFLLLVVAHVTANFWGTSIAPSAGRHERKDHDTDERTAILHSSTPPAGGAVRLRESSRPGWPMVAATALGAIVGGALGSITLVMLWLDQAGYAGVVVGSVSAAAVGGFIGFLTSSFAEIALRAWNEAVCGAATSAGDVHKRAS